MPRLQQPRTNHCIDISIVPGDKALDGRIRDITRKVRFRPIADISDKVNAQ